MAIPIGSNFLLGSGLPLDGRTVVANTTARDAIPSIQRYDGLIVYTTATSKNYQLRGGILNANWVDMTTGAVTPSALTKVDDTNVTLTLGGTPASALLQGVSLTLGWTGSLADARIASASTWNAKVSSQWVTTGSNIYYNTGNVVINGTTGSQKLTINGEIGIQAGNNFVHYSPSNSHYFNMVTDETTYYWKYDNGATARMYLTSGGNLTIASTATATNFILSSDRKLKTNIQLLDSSRPVTTPYVEFELLTDLGQKRVGVIAQDLEVEHPEFVRTDDKGIKSVAYIDLHSKEISDLKFQLKLMMDKIAELERKLL
jgi:hypothetical protein